jgi:hypothetical protein
MTASSMSSPTSSRSPAIISAGVYPGSRRPSSSTVTSLGMTLIFSPPRTMVALTVLCSTGSKTRPLLLNRSSIHSVRRGSRSPRRMVLVGNGEAAAIVSIKRRATGVTCTGRTPGQERPRRAGARPGRGARRAPRGRAGRGRRGGEARREDSRRRADRLGSFRFEATRVGEPSW